MLKSYIDILTIVVTDSMDYSLSFWFPVKERLWNEEAAVREQRDLSEWFYRQGISMFVFSWVPGRALRGRYMPKRAVLKYF